MSIEKAAAEAKAEKDSSGGKVRVGSPDKTRGTETKETREREEETTRVGSPDKTRGHIP
jgi:hypothetical protein